jgi:hypothetical protein
VIELLWHDPDSTAELTFQPEQQQDGGEKQNEEYRLLQEAANASICLT